MTTTPNGEKSDSHNNGYDDLTVIKGIGDATQQWLRERLNVRRYHDFTAMSAEEIETRMKAEGRIASRSKIEAWLAQAQGLAAAAQPVATDKPTGLQTETWKTIATFVTVFEQGGSDGQVQFRTEAHHMEADKTQRWSGIEPAQLGQWITEQLGPQVLQTLQAAESKEPGLSGKLQSYVAAARRLAGETGLSAAGTTASRVSVAQSPQAQVAETEQSAPTDESGVFSAKLRRTIQKARQLAGEETIPGYD